MSTYCHPILCLTLITLLTTIPSSSADTQLIIDTCKKIAQASPKLEGKDQICVGLLQSDPRSEAATLEGLAKISFELTRNKTVAVEMKIQSLMGTDKASPNVDASTKRKLKDCAEAYSGAEDSLKDALKAMNAKDYSTANIAMSAVLGLPSECEANFKGKVSPLAGENAEITQLYVIPLVFTKLLR